LFTLLFHENYFSTLFLSLLFIRTDLLSTMSYKCLNFNSFRPENFVIPSMLVRCMSYIHGMLSCARTCVRCTQTHFTCSQFYISPSAPVQHIRLSLARISLLLSFPIKLRNLTRALINNTSQR